MILYSQFSIPNFGRSAACDPIEAAGMTPSPRWGSGSVVQGHINYYGVPLNTAALHSFVFHVIRRWRRALQRRSQKGRMTTARMRPLVERWLPRVRIVHPYPSVRLGLRT